jgi:hypothetical protein
MRRVHHTIDSLPHYYDRQLLLADDFLAEQNYHLNALRRHRLHQHGWGVVRGLEIIRTSDNTIAVKPGYAIDAWGNDILIDKVENLDLAEFGPNDLVKIGLAYEEERLRQDSENKNRKRCYAVLTAVGAAEESPPLLLATIQLDEQGRVRDEAIDYSNTRYALTLLTPGSVTLAALAPELQTGWIRVSPWLRPWTQPPKGEEEIPPAFRVGATEARSPGPREGVEKDKGAAGTMAIPIPPGITKITRFRLAGAINDGQIMLNLILGGWNPVTNEHRRDTVIEDIFTGAPFVRTYAISDAAVNPEYTTLSLSVRGTRRTSLSLVAVEVKL